MLEDAGHQGSFDLSSGETPNIPLIGQQYLRDVWCEQTLQKLVSDLRRRWAVIYVWGSALVSPVLFNDEPLLTSIRRWGKVRVLKSVTGTEMCQTTLAPAHWNHWEGQSCTKRQHVTLAVKDQVRQDHLWFVLPSGELFPRLQSDCNVLSDLKSNVLQALLEAATQCAGLLFQDALCWWCTPGGR